MKYVTKSTIIGAGATLGFVFGLAVLGNVADNVEFMDALNRSTFVSGVMALVGGALGATHFSQTKDDVMRNAFVGVLGTGIISMVASGAISSFGVS